MGKYLFKYLCKKFKLDFLYKKFNYGKNYIKLKIIVYVFIFFNKNIIIIL